MVDIPKGSEKVKCTCGGILSVIRIEKDELNSHKPRLCDVECLECGKIYYSQPYDFGKIINPIKNLKNQSRK